jgi:FKBP-type peptidyl-prolyl cis-trans isomerase
VFIGVSKSKIKGYAEQMKHTFLVILMVALLSALSSCNNEGKTGSSSPEESFGKDASYALGMNVGTSLKADGIYPDVEAFTQGMKDILNDSKTRFTMEEAFQAFNEAFGILEEKREAESRQTEIAFLAENSKKPGIIITGSGLQYEIISEGSGAKPSYDRVVKAHYEGALVDGTVFDSSYARGEPSEFPLNGVIDGWTEGLQLMSIGSKYRFYIPSDMGYGPEGRPPQIPPFSTLIFEVELIDIMPEDYVYQYF